MTGYSCWAPSLVCRVRASPLPQNIDGFPFTEGHHKQLYPPNYKIFLLFLQRLCSHIFKEPPFPWEKRINLEYVIVYAIIFACLFPLHSQSNPLRRNHGAGFKDGQTDKGRLLSLTGPQSEYIGCQISMIWVNNPVQAFISPHLLFLRAYVFVYGDYRGVLL